MVFDLRRYRDRLILAAALAIAVHEVLLGLMPGLSRPDNTESEAQTTRIAIETPRPTPTPRRTPRPTPTPQPTVPPTPPPRITPPPRSTPAPRQQIAGRAKGTPAKRRGGGAHRAIAKAPSGHYANPNAAGSGTGSSTGAGSGDRPGLGDGLGGNGSGQNGNGNGAVNADTPCGFVEFRPHGAPRYSNGTATETIRATVFFPDGHSEVAEFPYKWIYPNGEQTDPWSSTNLRNNYPVTLQTPPPGSDVASYPPLVQYILQHSDSGGFTKLQDCPHNRG